MSDLVRVLGYAMPTEITEQSIGDSVRPFVPPCCARERFSVRIPDPRGATPHPDNLEWHQDGGGVKGSVRHMVVWSNQMPTQLRLPDGEEFQGEPGDVIWFNNDVVFHRQPTGTDETSRWFLGIRCSG